MENFAGQWLLLRNLRSHIPTPGDFPDFDNELRRGVPHARPSCSSSSIVREDRSVLDLLTADYTFVNERLARHYGIPNVYGSHFRRVTLPGEARRGLLGQGSILTVTSYPNRTSPVLRGKWILENILGHAAAGAAAERAGARRERRRRGGAGRCASGWRRTGATRRAPAAIG